MMALTTARANGGAVQRVADILLETSRTAKERLNQGHKENMDWVIAALRKVKCRVLGTEEEDGDVKPQASSLKRENLQGPVQTRE